MRKIKLAIEDLQVESFLTEEVTNLIGTVRTHQIAEEFVVAGTDNTCPPVNTCNQTHCGGYSCEWTQCAADTCKPAVEAAANGMDPGVFYGYGI